MLKCIILSVRDAYVQYGSASLCSVSILLVNLSWMLFRSVKRLSVSFLILIWAFSLERILDQSSLIDLDCVYSFMIVWSELRTISRVNRTRKTGNIKHVCSTNINITVCFLKSQLPSNSRKFNHHRLKLIQVNFTWVLLTDIEWLNYVHWRSYLLAPTHFKLWQK